MNYFNIGNEDNDNNNNNMQDITINEKCIFQVYPSKIYNIEIKNFNNKLFNSHTIAIQKNQKRMEIIIDQENNKEAHLRGRKGVLGISLGSSDIATVVGAGYANPVDFYNSLIYPFLFNPSSGNIATKHGTITEPLVSYLYELYSGRKVFPGNMWRISTPWISKLHPDCPAYEFELQSCSPDSLIYFQNSSSKTIFDIEYTAEFKSPYYKMYDNVPIHYLFQVMWQIYTLNIEFADFFAVKLSHDISEIESILWVRIWRNNDILKLILEKVSLFQHCCYNYKQPNWGRIDNNKLSSLIKNCKMEIKYKGKCDKKIENIFFNNTEVKLIIDKYISTINS